MNMQTSLPIGEIVRNISYKQINQSGESNRQRDIVKRTIMEHPEGITDTEICVLTGISRSSVNARRNELENIIPVGIAMYSDEFGNIHLNTLWGITMSNIGIKPLGV